MGESHLIKALYQAALKCYNSRAGDDFNEVKNVVACPLLEKVHKVFEVTQQQSIDNKLRLMLGQGRGRWAVAQTLILVTIRNKFTLTPDALIAELLRHRTKYHVTQCLLS